MADTVDAEAPPRARARTLFALGFLTLFLELALIRYLAGAVWNLGYFPNLVLTAVFIGMGVGFAFHGAFGPAASAAAFRSCPAVVLGLVVLVGIVEPGVPGFASQQGDIGGDVFFTTRASYGGFRNALPFVVCLAGVIAAFVLLSQRTAKLFRTFEPLTAYTLDIAGSCAGIVAFMGVSWLQVPAWAWFAATGLLFAAAAPGSTGARVFPAACGLAVAALVGARDAADTASEVRWSPYQRVSYFAGTRSILVNGLPHQSMETEGGIRRAGYQQIHDARRRDGLPPYATVLVIGAGSGNDVASALFNGAAHVDAVEIDPAIADLGRRHHPCRPYDDPRVSLVVDDGRAFMTRTTRRYDLVVFALTDSLVKVSSFAQLRLENYLFTREAAARAYALLAPGGDLVYYNWYRFDWIRDRIGAMAGQAAGRPAEILRQTGTFAVLRVRERGRAARETVVTELPVPTDDWPFLYLRERGITTVYVWGMAGITVLVASLLLALQRVTRRREEYAGARTACVKVAFVLMGVAFLLLETKGVIQFSLLFGTTWLNSSLVFLAVLLMVLAANWAARALRSRGTLPAVAVLVVASSLAMLGFPLRRLLALDPAARFALAALLTFSPIFFANLLFSVSLRDRPIAEHLFGWNLLGATLGGVLEYASMRTGYAALSIAVAALYAGAFGLLWASGIGRSPAR